jgi:integrase
MRSLLTLVREYLAHRRRLGFILRNPHRMLPQFARFHERVAPGQPLTVDVIIKWAVEPGTGSRNYHVARLRMVRAFARYCAALDPRVQVPDYDLLGRGFRDPRVRPHIYSSAEIKLILHRARQIPPRRSPLRPLTYETLLGFIACTGVRLNEAIRLRLEDVDLERGTVRVPHSKYSPERVLPLHPSTVRALRRYRETRVQEYPFGEHFFVGRAARCLEQSQVHAIFRSLVRGLVPNGERPRLRIHDLRHTFATRHIAQWNRESAPVTHRLLLLSRYLGHQNFHDTWWYVSAEPAMLRVAAKRFAQFHGGA